MIMVAVSRCFIRVAASLKSGCVRQGRPLMRPVTRFPLQGGHHLMGTCPGSTYGTEQFSAGSTSRWLLLLPPRQELLHLRLEALLHHGRPVRVTLEDRRGRGLHLLPGRVRRDRRYGRV